MMLVMKTSMLSGPRGSTPAGMSRSSRWHARAPPPRYLRTVISGISSTRVWRVVRSTCRIFAVTPDAMAVSSSGALPGAGYHALVWGCNLRPGRRRLPAVQERRLRGRQAPASAEGPARVAERDREMEAHALGDAEERVDAVHDVGVERRRDRADAEGARGEHQILAGGDDRIGGARRERQGQDDARHLLHLVGELRGGAIVLVLGRDVLELGPAAFVPALGPPRLVVELAELADQRPVRHHQKARDLTVAPVRRLEGGLEDEPDVLHGDRFGPEASDGTLGEDRLADGHGEPLRVHGHPLSPRL